MQHSFCDQVKQPVSGACSIWVPQCVPQWVFVEVLEAVSHKVLPRDWTLHASCAVINFDAVRSAHQNAQEISIKSAAGKLWDALALRWQCARRHRLTD